MYQTYQSPAHAYNQHYEDSCRILSVQGQPRLTGEFKASLDYIARFYNKTENQGLMCGSCRGLAAHLRFPVQLQGKKIVPKSEGNRTTNIKAASALSSSNSERPRLQIGTPMSNTRMVRKPNMGWISRWFLDTVTHICALLTPRLHPYLHVPEVT